MVAIEVMIFRRKRNPETYPCLPFSLIAYIHHNDNSHCNDYNRPSGADSPFELLGRYLPPILDLRFFLPPKRFLFVGSPIAFLALLHCLIFSFVAVTTHYPWHF